MYFRFIVALHGWQDILVATDTPVTFLGELGMTENTPQDQAKLNAAEAALAHVKDGMRLGIGTGSTAAIFVDLLAEKVKAGMTVVGVPTSERTAEQCRELGVPLTTLDETPELDLGIDGADEFDPELNLIKGGGGALLREKIVASCCLKFIVIADESKRVPVLGAFDLPVEVIQMAATPIKHVIQGYGAKVALRRDRWGDAFITDENNVILDCAFGPNIKDPVTLAHNLSGLAGMVEHGLFVGMCDEVIVGKPGGVDSVVTNRKDRL
jgi:ribose 5-phosphate isomerase A